MESTPLILLQSNFSTGRSQLGFMARNGMPSPSHSWRCESHFLRCQATVMGKAEYSIQHNINLTFASIWRTTARETVKPRHSLFWQLMMAIFLCSFCGIFAKSNRPPTTSQCFSSVLRKNTQKISCRSCNVAIPWHMAYGIWHMKHSKDQWLAELEVVDGIPFRGPLHRHRLQPLDV